MLQLTYEVMKYCKICLQPDTRPNTVFTENQICPACVYHSELQHVDWQERYEILLDLLEKIIPRRKSPHFDCIIGVSGGKDSTRQALWVRDKLGLNPLLVCLSFPPEQVTQRGVDNISNLIELGFNVLVSAPAPETWRKLMRESFFKFTNWARSTELALFSSVPQIAIRYNIPLILWGENPALQIGDLRTMGKSGYDGNNLRFSNTLCTGHEWMLDSGFSLRELLPYVYPSLDEFRSSSIQIVYLGWFLGDWSLLNNAAYACTNGLQIRAENVVETGDLHGISNLDEDWHNMNQMIKYYKFGFGKVTEYVNEELRCGRMEREHAIKLVREYDGACSEKYVESFCEYIDITTSVFWDHVRASANRSLFTVKSGAAIEPRFKVGQGL